MRTLIEPLGLAFLHALEPERAHGLTLKALKNLPLPRGPNDRRLAVRAFGLDFPNPIGMAAGFDKNAEVPDALLRLGFGFAECGTLTPKPQSGNPRPRIFRLPADVGLINRLGFNNEGHDAAHARLAARKAIGTVGVNIGANKDAADRAADYVAGIKRFADVASYFTVNISSPNTPGLRDLQQAAALDDLLARVLAARDETSAQHGRKPVLLKIAPDLTLADLDDIVRVARARAIDGMILSNTTITRPQSLAEVQVAKEQGGLSGKPLFPLATYMLAQTYQRVEGQFPLIGVGGIDSAQAAVEKIRAGASLVQLYSALVFKGLALIDDIKRGLVDELVRRKLNSIATLTGTGAAEWAARHS
ncbi:quinone-dependent dihydroorotate dehydrogenase [Methylovirgula sp. 4M-Z18]|uniref:quinone-dependent dihydroorotate dehydrogenase n=1 Tax=Methylovirgula sp. 4M-Z18 TaxID=2293567 RepID=UPI000E2EE1D7|nr:quinone-dependent dihydroorotate dehydrogenase [Methylovirgula sp. 4M-Z18]RFB78526.1 quinone-dependent dihydroorotate dehydrogenase [Methylovirgula sp. 4M-Z18]